MYCYCLHPDWLELFNNNQSRVKNIFEIVEKDPMHVPSLHEVFKPFEIMPLDKIKVVIIGQNPYNSAPGLANGIAFSVPPEIGTSATLETINQELYMSFGKGLSDCTLSNWVKQGVLLLNSCLTATLSKQDIGFSHDDVWTFFMENLVYWLSRNTTEIVFMLWGKRAERFMKLLKGTDSVVIKSPFPLSRNMKGDSFIGSNVFIKCNTALSKIGKQQIVWT